MVHTSILNVHQKDSRNVIFTSVPKFCCEKSHVVMYLCICRDTGLSASLSLALQDLGPFFKEVQDLKQYFPSDSHEWKERNTSTVRIIFQLCVSILVRFGPAGKHQLWKGFMFFGRTSLKYRSFSNKALARLDGPGWTAVIKSAAIRAYLSLVGFMCTCFAK